MAGHRRHPPRFKVLSAIGAGLAGLGLMVGVGLSVGPDNQPDLVPLLPTSSPNDRWTDAVEQPGKVLYRFDTVIYNKGGGALDVYRDAGDPTTFQKIWPTGTPQNALTEAPTGGINLGSAGQIRYSSVKGHNHFHTQLVAAYELDTAAGALVTKAAKNTAGFCLYDSWVSASQPDGYFADGTICHPQAPDYTGVVREGISSQYGDFYGSQLGDQWVDVTTVAPGPYLLRAEANPARLYTESDTSNNVATAPVTIPGATARATAAVVGAGGSVDIPVTGTVVAPEGRSRKPTCTDDQTGSPSCLTTADPARLSFRIASTPGAGTAQILDPTSDLSATARYTAPPGFTGSTTFSYVATDSRGLTSRPATVTVTVTGGAGGGGTQQGTGSTPAAAKASVALRARFRLVHRGPRTYLAVRGTLPRTLAGRRVRVQRKLGRRIVTIGGARVGAKGHFSRLIRIRARTLSVRASIGSSPRTRAATTSFRRVR